MTLGEIIKALQAMEKKVGPEVPLHVMIEVNEPEKCQYEFEANDVAMVRGADAYVVIMHEKWTSE